MSSRGITLRHVPTGICAATTHTRCTTRHSSIDIRREEILPLGYDGLAGRNHASMQTGFHHAIHIHLDTTKTRNEHILREHLPIRRQVAYLYTGRTGLGIGKNESLSKARSRIATCEVPCCLRSGSTDNGIATTQGTQYQVLRSLYQDGIGGCDGHTKLCIGHSIIEYYGSA